MLIKNWITKSSETWDFQHTYYFKMFCLSQLKYDSSKSSKPNVRILIKGIFYLIDLRFVVLVCSCPLSEPAVLVLCQGVFLIQFCHKDVTDIYVTDLKFRRNKPLSRNKVDVHFTLCFFLHSRQNQTNKKTILNRNVFIIIDYNTEKKTHFWKTEVSLTLPWFSTAASASAVWRTLHRIVGFYISAAPPPQWDQSCSSLHDSGYHMGTQS